MSIVTSSIAAYARMAAEYPDLVDYLRQPIHFSRQQEQAPDETPSYPNPIFDEVDGALFSKWNRNRMESAQKLEGVPRSPAAPRSAGDVRPRRARARPRLHDVSRARRHAAREQPRTVHSRTDFVDHKDPAKKRTLFRLWLATPDGERLPESWRRLRAVEPARCAAASAASSTTSAAARSKRGRLPPSA